MHFAVSKLQVNPPTTACNLSNNHHSVRRFQLTKPIDRSHFQLYLLCHESSQHQGIGHLENENKDTSLTMNKGGTLCLSQETSQVASICTQAPSQKDEEVAWV